MADRAAGWIASGGWGRLAGMVDMLWVAAGGAVGAVLRWITSRWGQGLVAGDFPLGTLIVNVLGCLALGLAIPALTRVFEVREEVRVGVIVGVLGAFTTFSTFGWETVDLVIEGKRGVALGYVLVSLVGGFLAVWIGYRAGLRWAGV